ncbi:UDP-N-acetylmuramate dehydrogenase [Helicobacter aurati]|uniref:UDP-N-acetylenolpyruvoylglucosamine reductase n=1 Tax=Helicobacter aurati TaxID=137778 RepID=A0A3D8J7H2_9HELI|nr:UDP-N-acetylmuramate dehydrogenase [Helicobacter aurati]RDU73447.1 UDP-N-acetylmuramate dehydrogenase [Helicobacter aurati]
MEVKEIDFTRYSSIRIGAKTAVFVIERHDVGAEFVEYQPHTFTSKLPSYSCHNKVQILNNLTLHVPLACSLLNFVDLASCVRYKNDTLYVIGRANNLLVSPNVSNLAMLGESFNYISDIGEYIEMGASVNSLQAFLYFKKYDIRGLEFLKDLPGVVGALCNMNAGMKDYEIKDTLAQLNINGQWIDVEHLGLHYRGRDSKGIIFAARFHKQQGFRKALLHSFSAMRKFHPHKPSCGSCFKNPPNNYAGRLLESVGLKGFAIRDIAFSTSHANFLVNLGHANFDDAIALIGLAKERVYEHFGIMLECEVKICK